jgi:hypothetical protein
MGTPKTNILSENTKAKIMDEVTKIFMSVFSVFLGEVSSSLDNFSKDIAAKSVKASKAQPLNCNTEEVEAK